MSSRFHLSLPFHTVLLLLLLAGRLAATDVLSYHNDQQNTGQNLTEKILTPANVNPATFRKRWSIPVDGNVYAQPLYLENVSITVAPNAGLHNVVFAATEHNSVYAIDASTGITLWQISLLSTSGLPGTTEITTVPNGDVGVNDITPEIGITATPVIDPVGKVIYVSSKSKQTVSGNAYPNYVHTIFKLSLANGAIVASNIVAATYVDTNGYEYRTDPDPTAPQDPFVLGAAGEAVTINGQSRVYFNGLRQLNRPGLLLYKGNLYVAYASHGDNQPFHGWMLSFDAGTLALNGVFNTTPNGSEGGIWQTGGIPAVDEFGNFYFMTGNGTIEGESDGMGGTTGLDANGFPSLSDYGESVVKLGLDPTTTVSNQGANGWGFKVLDYFSPFNNQQLDTVDYDLGSGGVLILPDNVGSIAHPHLLLGAGKEGKIYLLDRDNLGKYNANTDNVLQEQAMAMVNCFSSPTYFNGHFYYVGAHTEHAQIYTIANAAFSPQPVSTALREFEYPGATFSVSASGAVNGLVWALERSSNELRAYNALDFSQELYDTDMAANQRDTFGVVGKFSVPTVADGFVFASSASSSETGFSNSILAYGAPPAPESAPAAPTGLTAKTVTGGQVNLAWVDHAKNEDGYAVEQSPDGVNFSQIATLGVRANATVVSGLTLSTYYAFRVRAFNSYQGGSYSAYSDVASVVTEPQPPLLSFGSGFTGSSSVLTFVGSAKLLPSGLAQLTDGGASETGAFWTLHPQSISHFVSQFAFQLTAATAEGFTFCLQRAGPTKLGTGGSDLGYAALKPSAAIKFDLAPNLSTTGFYAGGAAPDDNPTQAIDLTPSGLDLHSGDVFQVQLIYDGTTLTETVTDASTNATFVQAYTVNLPKLLEGTTAYIGFTGATSANTAVQSVQSWTFAPLPTAPPPVPTGLKAAVASSTGCNLTWRDTSDQVAGFLLRRRVGTTGAFQDLAALPAGTTSYMDSALTPGTGYSYTLRATDAAGLSNPTSAVLGITPTLPADPTKARTTSVTAHEVVLAWQDNAHNATSIQVLRQSGTGHLNVIATLAPTADSYADRLVVPSTAYTYEIHAVNLAGASSSGDIQVTTPTQ